MKINLGVSGLGLVSNSFRFYFSSLLYVSSRSPILMRTTDQAPDLSLWAARPASTQLVPAACIELGLDRVTEATDIDIKSVDLIIEIR